jgi:hypothetical protein
MPDGPDYRTPMPDRGHEAIRAPLAAAIADLSEQVQRIDDAFLMLLATCDFADATLRTVLAGQAAITALRTSVEAVLIRERTIQDTIDGLQQRLTAVEQALTEDVGITLDPQETP